MRYGYKFQQNTTTTFAVENYVLPRFSVQIRTDNYILPSFTDVNIDVRAKFVNQKTVHGFVSFRFSIKNELGKVEEIGTSNAPKMLQDGQARYVLSRDDLAARLGERKLDALFGARARLVVEATVMEEATAIRESARSEQAVFTTTPYLLSVARTERSFKPNEGFYVMVDVTYANGGQAAKVKTKLTCDCKSPLLSGSTDYNGVVSFFVVPKANSNEIKITVETSDSYFQRQEQAQKTFTVRLYRNGSGKYIYLQRRDLRVPIKAHSTYDAHLFTSSNAQLTSAYYLVLSRGRILKASSLDIESGGYRGKVSFEVTPEMTPSFRVIVFGFLNGELATDAVYVNAEPSCTDHSQFTLTRKKPINPTEPGAEEILEVAGTAGTRVGLLGLDQAVYVLRRKDLLTRDKVFRAMEDKDLGHGVDAGTTAEQALTNSGVVLLSAQNAFGASVNHRRMRREVSSNIVDEFQNETLRNCCSSGLKRDPFLRSCQEREDALRSYLTAGTALYSEQCVEAFAKCCVHFEEKQPVARSNNGGADKLGRSAFNFEGTRHDFRELLTFDQLTIKENGKVNHHITLPHSITTWELSAVSVAPSGGICVHEPLEIQVLKKLFVEVNLPYSVIEKEQVEVPVTVYNYASVDETVRVAMLGTEDVCSGAKVGKPSEVQTLKIPRGQGGTAVFPIVPLVAGEKIIHVSAISSSSGRDAAKVTLRVKPPGLRTSESITLILDPENTQKREGRHVTKRQHEHTETHQGEGTQLITIESHQRSPQEAVPGSERCEIDITGDGVGPALEASVNNPERLMRLPTGCGEQTMTKLAPTLYALEYLKTTDRLSPQVEKKALSFIKSGYQAMTTYRKRDGSFSVWTHSPSSLWLTAFVVRTLCEARKFIDIHEHTLTSGLLYILKQQQVDGRFHDNYHLRYINLTHGVTSPVLLTAYTLLTLHECAKDGAHVPGLKSSSAIATAFIEEKLKSYMTPFELSLVAYALSFTDSRNKSYALHRLLNTTAPGTDGGLHVPANSEPMQVQATSYALLALLNTGKNMDTITGLVRWLNLRMGPSGSMQSTQDTVVALQALSKYSIYARNAGIDLTCEVTLSGNRAFHRTVRIKRENAQVRNKIEIPISKGKIFVKVNGSGKATLNLITSYDVPVSADFLCKFDLNITFDDIKFTFDKALYASRKFERKYEMTVCARYLEPNGTGMAILDVGLLTGFKPVEEDLKQLVVDGHVDYYEVAQRNVIFYLPSIPADRHVCVQFGLQQDIILGKLLSSAVKVYAYYEPEISCTKFYLPNTTRPLLKFDCENPSSKHSQVCTCLEGGCPPKDVKDAFTKDEEDAVMTIKDCREGLRYHACDAVDFVWLGKALSNTTSRDGFFYVEFLISQVLKPGGESETELVDKIRQIKARDHCDSFRLKNNETYIVMGMDSKKMEEDSKGEEQYVYVIDSDSVVIQIPSAKSKTTTKLNAKRGEGRPCEWGKLVTWFIDQFSNETTRCFS
ncbi:complement C3-like isoform X2 [Dermacentor albipictus]|uniref:complement C3-like isoform X2 n=1 Tax=Dermacentor albipictus TaxID=60249 RepID=UPI0038FD26B5